LTYRDFEKPQYDKLKGMGYNLKTLKISIIIICIFTYTTAISAQNFDENHPISKGIEFFRQARYNEAITVFKYILIDPGLASVFPDAYFWLTKSYMGLLNFPDAAKTLEFYISHYPAHYNYAEALYQKGRLLFMQNEYENSIAALSDFIDKNPTNPFVSNAFFWLGESLYLLGNFGEASKVFKQIIQGYPDSFKFEAAKYRIALIEFKKREDELLKLLKWSHMETMKTQDEFSKREKTYEQAISIYQKKIALAESGKGSKTVSTDKEVQAELDAKAKEIQRLKQDIDGLKKQVDYLSNLASGITTTDQQGKTDKGGIDESQRLANEARLLQIKEEALALKEKLLKVLEQALEGK